jgi:hypothetical protein
MHIFLTTRSYRRLSINRFNKPIDVFGITEMEQKEKGINDHIVVKLCVFVHVFVCFEGVSIFQWIEMLNTRTHWSVEYNCIVGCESQHRSAKKNDNTVNHAVCIHPARTTQLHFRKKKKKIK